MPAPEAAAQGGNTVTETIVSPNSARVWKAHKDGVEQGTAWRQLGFDDSSWEDETMKFYESHGTVRGNGFYAYYFREEFEITDTFQISDLELDLYYDDAAVVYLNGTEIVRQNLPAGALTFDTAPLTTVWGDDERNYTRYELPAELLVDGENVLAVEAHNYTAGNSDLSFGLELIAE